MKDKESLYITIHSLDYGRLILYSRKSNALFYPSCNNLYHFKCNKEKK